MSDLFRSLTWALFLWIGFATGEASGLVIYRFGGEALEPPPEASGEGVEFIQLSWTDIEAERGGKATEVGLDSASIWPLKRDPDFNIAPGIEEKGGAHLRPNINREVWDGDTGVFWLAEKYICAQFRGRGSCTDDFGRQGTANIFLGSRYRIDRIRIISGLTDPSRTVRTFRVHIGQLPVGISFSLTPEPLSPWIVEVRDNREQILDVPIPAHEDVEFVQVTVGEHGEDWEVNEIEIYAKGFAEQATYISNILDFGQPMAWGDLRWSGRQDPKAQVLIQSRSGQDEDPNLFWRFTGRGDEKTPVSRTEYTKLAVGEKAGTGYDQANWTFWSSPYAFADSNGTPVVSLSPRRYLQLRIDFLPQDDDGGQVDFLEVRASLPVATQLVGEVWPVEVKVGQPQQFTYVLRPTIGVDNGGFDRLEVNTVARLGPITQVRVGDEPVDYAVEAAELHRVVVSIPRLTAEDSGALVEVVFEAEVLRYGSAFSMQVWDSALPLEVPQSVQEGDATPAYEDNRVWVATKAEHQGVLQLSRKPAVLTPNRDERNDEVGLGYQLVELTGRSRVAVAVCDLSGRRVRQVYEGLDGIGTYEQLWDGRDESGRLVPPGLYLYRVAVEVDHQTVEAVKLLHVAY